MTASTREGRAYIIYRLMTASSETALRQIWESISPEDQHISDILAAKEDAKRAFQKKAP